VVQDGEGGVVKEGAVETTEEGLKAMVEEVGAPAGTKMGVETGTQATWAARTVERLGMKPVVIDAHEVRAKARRVGQKSDRRDAWELCDGVRRKLYTAIVYIPIWNQASEGAEGLTMIREQRAIHHLKKRGGDPASPGGRKGQEFVWGAASPHHYVRRKTSNRWVERDGLIAFPTQQGSKRQRAGRIRPAPCSVTPPGARAFASPLGLRPRRRVASQRCRSADLGPKPYPPAGHSHLYNTVPVVSTARSEVHASTLTFPLTRPTFIDGFVFDGPLKCELRTDFRKRLGRAKVRPVGLPLVVEDREAQGQDVGDVFALPVCAGVRTTPCSFISARHHHNSPEHFAFQ